MGGLPRDLVLLWAALFGAVLGSFLNVVIARVPFGRSVVHPGSSCPHCGTPIAWFDNVPIVSWIVLRARCRACRAPISLRYPLVEALGAVIAVVAVLRHGVSAPAAAELAFAGALVALAFIDLDTWLLPHAITWPILGAGVAAAALGWSSAPGLASSLLGAAVGFGSFAAVSVLGARLFRREALGWGDVWLLGGIGAWLGARALLPVVLLASAQGSVFGLALLLLGRSQPGPRPAPAPEAAPGSAPGSGSETGPVTAPEVAPGLATDDRDWVPPRNAVPFGPFLALGALEWLYLGALLPHWVPILGVFR